MSHFFESISKKNFIIICLLVILFLIYNLQYTENFETTPLITVFSFNSFNTICNNTDTTIDELSKHFGFQYSYDKHDTDGYTNYGQGRVYTTLSPNPCYYYVYPSNNYITTTTCKDLSSSCKIPTNSHNCASSIAGINSSISNCCSISGQNITNLGSLDGLLQINLYSTDKPISSDAETAPRTELRGLDPIPDNGTYIVTKNTDSSYYFTYSSTCPSGYTCSLINRNYVFQFDQFVTIDSSKTSPQFIYAFAQVFGGAGPNILIRAKSTGYQLLINYPKKNTDGSLEYGTGTAITLYSGTSKALNTDDVGKWVKWTIFFRFSNDSTGYVDIYRNNNLSSKDDTSIGTQLTSSSSSSSTQYKNYCITGGTNCIYATSPSSSKATYNGPIVGGNGISKATKNTILNYADPTNTFLITSNCDSGSSNTSYIKHGIYSHTDTTYTNIYNFTTYTRTMHLYYQNISGNVTSSPTTYSC